MLPAGQQQSSVYTTVWYSCNHELHFPERKGHGNSANRPELSASRQLSSSDRERDVREVKSLRLTAPLPRRTGNGFSIGEGEETVTAQQRQYWKAAQMGARQGWKTIAQRTAAPLRIFPRDDVHRNHCQLLFPCKFHWKEKYLGSFFSSGLIVTLNEPAFFPLLSVKVKWGRSRRSSHGWSFTL